MPRMFMNSFHDKPRKDASGNVKLIVGVEEGAVDETATMLSY